MARLKAIIEISLLVGLGKCACDLTKCIPWVTEDILFLSILMIRGKAASMRREVPRIKEHLISNRKRSLFYLKYFETGPLEPGYKMCNLQKKNSNMVSTKAK